MIDKKSSRYVLLLLILVAATSMAAFYAGRVFKPEQPNENEYVYNEKEVELTANPNPFKDYTVITVYSEYDFRGSLEIKDRDQNTVNYLYSGTFKQGDNQITWDGTNESGLPLEPGEYICELILGSRYTSRTIILILK